MANMLDQFSMTGITAVLLGDKINGNQIGIFAGASNSNALINAEMGGYPAGYYPPINSEYYATDGTCWIQTSLGVWQQDYSLAGITPGIALASHALMLGANGDINSLRYTISTITALGSTQGGAAALTGSDSYSVTGTSGTGVMLPVPVAGVSSRIIVANLNASNALLVYPQVSSYINGVQNTGVSVAANAMTEFHSMSATQWFSK